jgi:hypothetical protein
MKTLTPNTILKQADKTFTAVEVDGNIIWIDKKEFADETIAQTSPILKDIPVISFDSYVKRLSLNIGKEKYIGGNYDFENGVRVGYKSNPAKWTDEDMERAIEMARKFPYVKKGEITYDLTAKEIINNLSEISVIEVDNDFNVITIK